MEPMCESHLKVNIGYQVVSTIQFIMVLFSLRSENKHIFLIKWVFLTCGVRQIVRKFDFENSLEIMGEREFDELVKVMEHGTLFYVFLSYLVFHDSVIRYLSTFVLIGMMIVGDLYLQMKHPDRLGLNVMYLVNLVVALIAFKMLN